MPTRSTRAWSCIRSGTNIYNLSLLSSIIDANGERGGPGMGGCPCGATWPATLPGGDTDQLKGIVSGECDIAVTNTYYFLRALDGGVDGLSGSTDMIGWVFPNQSDRGAQCERGGGRRRGERAEPGGSRGLPGIPDHAGSAGLFRQHEQRIRGCSGCGPRGKPRQPRACSGPTTLNLSVLGENQPLAQTIFNEVGWE